MAERAGDPVLECQDCGAELRVLSAREVQVVAQRPYDFVVLCRTCRATSDRVERLHDY